MEHTHEHPHHEHHHHHHPEHLPIKIFIDEKPHEVHHHRRTGKQLKEIGHVPLEGYDLFLERHNEDDKKIRDEEEVELHHHERFFSAKCVLNPGDGNNA